eukprot:g2414.t1
MKQSLAYFIALILGGLAVLLKINPEIVLQLPNGFIAYAILGHHPPAHFCYDAWKKEEFDGWAKDGDLIVSVGGKCGTNWLLYMSHLIRIKGDVDTHPLVDVNVNCPWPTLRHQPGMEWPEIKEKMFNGTIRSKDGRQVAMRTYWDHEDYPFRIFKSHEEPEDAGRRSSAVLPVRRRRGVKFLAAVRSPFDQLRSIYPFFKNHDPAFRRMWGDFPPVYDTKEQLFDDFMDGGPLAHLVWDYPRTWFAYKDEPNVLVFRFEKMLKDPERHVRELAAFLEVELTDTQIERIVFLSSFAEMKKVDDRFDYLLWAHRTNKERRIMQTGTLLRSGKKGEGKIFFDEEERTVIQDHIDRHFPRELRDWMGV